jgi:hypothetical protein
MIQPAAKTAAAQSFPEFDQLLRILNPFAPHWITPGTIKSRHMYWWN